MNINYGRITSEREIIYNLQLKLNLPLNKRSKNSKLYQEADE